LPYLSTQIIESPGTAKMPERYGERCSAISSGIGVIHA
jgi:hypothetical protein